jgi:hypothetical protein
VTWGQFETLCETGVLNLGKRLGKVKVVKKIADPGPDAEYAAAVNQAKLAMAALSDYDLRCAHCGTDLEFDSQKLRHADV